MAQIVKLENDSLELGICPECGAGLAYFRTKGNKLFDIMRAASQTAVNKKDPLGLAMFVMLPYTHRIKGGEFTYWGIKRQVPKTHPAFDDPIHGDGWRTIWTVVEKTTDKVVLEMTHTKEKDKGFPFSYSAQIVYQLKGKSLNMEISLKNNGVMPMPCGFGIHPFFNKTPNVSLNFKTKNVWWNQNDPIDHPYKTPVEYDFSIMREIKDDVFDTCFGGYEDSASIEWPKFGVKLNMKTDENFGHIVLYAPFHKNFFCLEPTSMACNAFNMAANGVIGSGIKSLSANEKITGNITFEIEGI